MSDWATNAQASANRDMSAEAPAGEPALECSKTHEGWVPLIEVDELPEWETHLEIAEPADGDAAAGDGEAAEA